MIDHTVHRGRVLRAADDVVDGAVPADASERAALEALRASADAHRSTAPHGTKAFMPTDGPLSVLQAFAEEDLAPRAVPRERPKAALATSTATGPEQDEDDERPFHFSTWDPGWIKGMLVRLVNSFDRRDDFRRPDADPATVHVANDARILLVSDWGTGETMATEVAVQMRREIAEARRAGREVHVVHLGDIYYAGTCWEARHRFLAHWPVDPDETGVRSWCLNANHDMYSGASGLLDVVLEDPRFAAQRTTDGRRTTEFHLRSEHWQLLGLDSAWLTEEQDFYGEQGRIDDAQVAWMERQLRDDVGTVLLSHHQPFTRDAAGLTSVGNLMAMTRDLRPRVDAWFWGHEHRLFVYGPQAGIGYAACIGHGAIPTAVGDTDVADVGEWEYRDFFVDDDGDAWRFSGFAVLDLADSHLVVRYLNQHGEEIGTERVDRRVLSLAGAGQRHGGMEIVSDHGDTER